MSDNINNMSSQSKGKKNIEHIATLNDFRLFITECFTQDKNILPCIDDFRNEDSKDPMLPETWDIYQICTDVKNFNTVSGIVYSLESYFDNADYWGGYQLYYKDENNVIIEIDKNKIRQVATMWMPSYDTKYRINIFDTTDGYLLLGINEPD